MRLLRPIPILAVLLLAQLSAMAGEMAVLRNGFSIRFDHKEQNGATTRLYTGTGYVDIASDQIASYEQEEAPAIPAAATTAGASAVTGHPSTDPAQAVPAQTAAALQPVSTQTNPTQSDLTQANLTQANLTRANLTQANGNQANLDAVIREASRKNRLDPDFVTSVIKAESNFKPRAVSPKGARGLMQLMPGTASQLGVSDPFDPRANVEAGAAHLSALLDQYHDDPIKALAAYNAGAHRVKQYNGVPPYRETRAYIAKIVRDFNAKKRAQMKAVGASTAARSKPATGTARTTASRPSKKNKPQQAQLSKPTSPA